MAILNYLLSKTSKTLAISALFTLISCSDESELLKTYRIPKETKITAEILPFSWEKPLSWKSAPPGPMKKAQFEITYSDEEAEAFLVHMPGKFGALLDNINRWRKQIALPPLSSLDEINLEHIKTPLGEIQVYTCTNEKKNLSSIISFWKEDKGNWFFKINGSSKVVSHEKASFISVLKSMRPL